MARKRSLQIFLAVLALVLFGTVALLSSISYYLAIDPPAYLSDELLGWRENGTRWNATEHGLTERIPRIIHQTWRTNTLPDRWQFTSQGCRTMMPDYEYMLWTDASSREFIASEYPWFLDTFDAYKYPIQRADAIRYFVLFHYGGVYADLDVGCLRPLDPLLVYPVILPKTIPVGVSNDLMFSEKGHPFMAQVIHNLATFDIDWVLNYPTVMFSTGPMFLSAQWGVYTSSHPPSPEQPGGEVRVLPKSLYGKNAKIEEAPFAFFSHYYGSSWHADDAAFIGFLGKWGKNMMWIGLFILIIGIVKPVLERKKKRSAVRRLSVLLPSSYQRGRWTLDLRSFPVPLSISSPTSPISLTPTSPLSDDSVPLVPFSFDVRPFSPSPSEASSITDTLAASGTSAVDAFLRAGSRVVASVTGSASPREAPPRRTRSRNGRSVLFFLPTVFTPAAQTSEPSTRRNSGSWLTSPRVSRSTSASVITSLVNSAYPQEKRRHVPDLEAGPDTPTYDVVMSDPVPRGMSRSASTSSASTITPSSSSAAPPPYPEAIVATATVMGSSSASESCASSTTHSSSSSWSSQSASWDEWDSELRS